MEKKVSFQTKIKKQRAQMERFFTAEGFTISRDYAGNFNRGLDLYYKEIKPNCFFVFSNNQFSLEKEFERFEFSVVEANTKDDFVYKLLQKEPRIVVKTFKPDLNMPLYEEELQKAME
ncbi:MAG: hypothetical protein PHV20_07325 [Bacteroidales bacterium]|nr:hypothetical protein [Bacteroidales bacterium]